MIDAATWALQLGGIVATGLVAVLAWSLRKNLQTLEVAIAAVQADLRAVTAIAANHEASLRAGTQRFESMDRLSDERFSQLEKRWNDRYAEAIARVKDLEDRERLRGCFGACRNPIGG